MSPISKNNCKKLMNKAWLDLFTCTVSSTKHWLDKLINVVISWTGFDSYRMGFVSTAVTPWGDTDLTGDHSILQLWVSAVEHQWIISATRVLIYTWFWHLSIFTIVEHPVPAIPPHIIITHAIVVIVIIVRVVCGSPRLIQTGIVVAGVDTWGAKRYYYKKFKLRFNEFMMHSYLKWLFYRIHNQVKYEE